MSFIFPNEKDDEKEIDIDELFDINHRKDLKQISIFNKILNRVHNKIKYVSRSRSNDKHIWFSVPEYIFGEPIYNNGDCISYLVRKLQENSFLVKYLHPNNLFISWKNWIPAYVRDEFKRSTGKKINSRGEIIEVNETQQEEQTEEEQLLFGANLQNNQQDDKQKREYTSTKDYKPQGKLIYDQSLFDNLEKKVTFK